MSQSHTVRVTTTTTTTSSSALVLNTGYLKTLPGLLKVAEFVSYLNSFFFLYIAPSMRCCCCCWVCVCQRAHELKGDILLRARWWMAESREELVGVTHHGMHMFDVRIDLCIIVAALKSAAAHTHKYIKYFMCIHIHIAMSVSGGIYAFVTLEHKQISMLLSLMPHRTTDAWEGYIWCMSTVSTPEMDIHESK